MLPLALLARDGHGKAIEKAVKDPTASPRLRTIGAIALSNGGYKPPVNLLAQMIERTKEDDLRAAALITLGRSDHPRRGRLFRPTLMIRPQLVQEAASFRNGELSAIPPIRYLYSVGH